MLSHPSPRKIQGKPRIPSGSSEGGVCAPHLLRASFFLEFAPVGGTGGYDVEVVVTCSFLWWTD